MNKFLIGTAILLSSILIIVNFAAGNGFTHIIIGYSNPGMLAIIGIIIGFIGGFGIKGFISEKQSEKYDNNDEGLNF